MTTQEREFATREASRIIAEHAEMKRLLQDWLDAANSFPREVRHNAGMVERATVTFFQRHLSRESSIEGRTV